MGSISTSTARAINALEGTIGKVGDSDVTSVAAIFVGCAGIASGGAAAGGSAFASGRGIRGGGGAPPRDRERAAGTRSSACFDATVEGCNLVEPARFGASGVELAAYGDGRGPRGALFDLILDARPSAASSFVAASCGKVSVVASTAAALTFRAAAAARKPPAGGRKNALKLCSVHSEFAPQAIVSVMMVSKNDSAS